MLVIEWQLWVCWNCRIKLFKCSNSWLLFWIKLFWDFCLKVWKPWICGWLLFKHDFNYLLDDWVCLYIVGFWIVGVVCEVWIELWKNEFLVENESDFEFMVRWWYKLMTKSVLVVSWSMLTINKICVTIFGQLGSKWDFWEVLMCVPDREPISGFPCSGVARWASSISPWWDVQSCTRNFVHLRAYGVISGHP